MHAIASTAPAPEPAPAKPVSRSFAALYTLANIGAYLCFVPLLQILVPLRAVAIEPVQGAMLLSRVALCGAIVASLANILFGALSDRSRMAGGSRRPWVLGGVIATLCSYVLICRAASPVALLIGVASFQVAFNALFAPLGAVLADEVPDSQKGALSGLLGLGHPLASMIGAVAVGEVAAGAARYVVLGGLVAACIVPFAWRLRRATRPALPLPLAPVPPATPATLRALLRRPWRKAGLNPFAHRDFTLAWLGRLLVEIALSLMQGYLLLYLRYKTGAWAGMPARPEAAFAQLATLITCTNIACALAGGWCSDRIGHRRAWVVAGGACMAAGIAGVALAGSWGWLMFATLLYGAGGGLYYATNLALIVQVLPNKTNAGKDLGIVNLANTVPQFVAPLLALQVLGGAAPDYRGLFLLAGGAALAGACCVVPIRKFK